MPLYFEYKNMINYTSFPVLDKHPRGVGIVHLTTTPEVFTMWTPAPFLPPCQNGFLVLPYDQFLQNQVSRIRFSASIQPPARHLYRTPQFFAHESQKGVPIALKTSACK